MQRTLQRQRCPNDNHGRSVVTVRFCASCGEIVNAKILAWKCEEQTHAARRRSRNTHCVDCGVLLLTAVAR